MLRKLAVACAAAATLFAFGAAPALASLDDLVGNWTNQNTSSDGVTRISVTRRPSGARVRVFGRCHPTDCDWGEVDARPFARRPGGDPIADSNVLMATYDLPLGRKTVILRQTAGGGASYEVFTDFNDSRADYLEGGALRRMMLPTPPFPIPGGGGAGGHGGHRPDLGGEPRPGGGGGGASLSEDCIDHNIGNLQVANIGGRWKITDGSHLLLDFGGNRAAADRSLQIIRHYGFTMQCFVARPNAAMSYWRRGSGISAAAPLGGEDCINVNPTNVQARNVGGAWKVVDGSNWLLDYGSNRANAEQAVRVIQNYNLNRQCFVARPNPPMQYWLSR
jgi:hypothetical protein